MAEGVKGSFGEARREYGNLRCYPCFFPQTRRGYQRNTKRRDRSPAGHAPRASFRQIGQLSLPKPLKTSKKGKPPENEVVRAWPQRTVRGSSAPHRGQGVPFSSECNGGGQS